VFDWLRRKKKAEATPTPKQLLAAADRLDALAAPLRPHLGYQAAMAAVLAPKAGSERERFAAELIGELLQLNVHDQVLGDPRAMAAQMRADGLSTVLAQYQQTAGRLSPGSPDNELTLDLRFCDSLFRANRIAQRICTVLPGECTRKGWEVTYGDDAPEGDPLGSEFVRLGLAELFQHADILARKDGGCALFLGIDDGRRQDEPVDESAIQRITHATLIERWHCYPLSWEDRFDQPGFGEPLLWQVTPYSPGGAAKSSQGPAGTQTGPLAIVHKDRLIVWGGVWLPPRLRAYNAYHDDSVFQACWRPLMGYRSTMREIEGLVRSFSTGALTLRGLAQAAAAGHGEQAFARLASLNVGLGMGGMALLDEGEKLEYATRSVAGLAELIGHQKEDLCAAAEMPATMLFGQSPGGLSTDDKSGARFWYARVADRQSTIYQPRLRRAGHLLAMAQQGPCQGIEPEGWDVAFRPLEQMTDAETAALRLAVAQADQLYWTMGALSETEIRDSRYGRAQYSIETTLSEAPPTGAPAG